MESSAKDVAVTDRSATRLARRADHSAAGTLIASEIVRAMNTISSVTGSAADTIEATVGRGGSNEVPRSPRSEVVSQFHHCTTRD